MLTDKGGVILRLFFAAFALSLLAGCSLFDNPSRFDLNAKWVSKDGKTQEQLYSDQAECKRDTMMMSPPGFSGPGGGGGGGWGMSEMKAFDGCMQAKGWKKE